MDALFKNTIFPDHLKDVDVEKTIICSFTNGRYSKSLIMEAHIDEDLDVIVQYEVHRKDKSRAIRYTLKEAIKVYNEDKI